MNNLPGKKADFLIKTNSRITRIAAIKLRSENVAIVMGKTIHLYHVSEEDFLKDTKWVKHEMCHVNQFKKYGFLKFILKYLFESMRHGYYNNKYELEARNAENI